MILPALLIAQSVCSQIAIGGKETITNHSVSIEFDDDNNRANNARGLILPWVTSTTAVENGATTIGRTVANGTLIFDISDKKVKLKKPGGWEDLTLSDSGTVNTSLQKSKQETENSKVAIGQASTNADGILVLEDKDKAMILPLVDDYQYIMSPEPGTMVFDFSRHMLCFFNGTEWTFWTY